MSTHFPIHHQATASPSPSLETVLLALRLPPRAGTLPVCGACLSQPWTASETGNLVSDHLPVIVRRSETISALEDRGSGTSADLPSWMLPPATSTPTGSAGCRWPRQNWRSPSFLVSLRCGFGHFCAAADMASRIKILRLCSVSASSLPARLSQRRASEMSTLMSSPATGTVVPPQLGRQLLAAEVLLRHDPWRARKTTARRVRHKEDGKGGKACTQCHASKERAEVMAGE